MRQEMFADQLTRLFPEENNEPIRMNGKFTKSITFQVTENCNMRCTYCYQHEKRGNRMTFDVAKRFIDMLLAADERTNQYITSTISQGVILDFIGGEPFLEVELIDQICDYFLEQAMLLHHPWATRFRIGISTNGLLYFDPKVQAFIKKWHENLSLGVSIDGNKELHDACRLDVNGDGTYDRAIAAVKHYREHYRQMVGSKMTIAPGNVNYVFSAVKSMIDNGYTYINLNCVYEEGWTTEHARILYEQCKQLSDYLIENDLVDKIYLSLLDKDMAGTPLPERDNRNWCWGKGTPILTSSGYKPIEEIKIGDLVYTHTGELKPVINTMHHFDENVCTIKASGIYDLTCTKNHKLFTRPFDYIDSNGEKHYKDDCIREVKDINENDLLFLYNDASKINYVKNEYTECTTYGLRIKDAEPQEVYNVTVEDNHSYIAGGLLSSNCGGTGLMTALDWKGDIFPCIRYMDNAICGKQPSYTIGNVEHGIMQTDEEVQRIKCFECITRRSQSTDECWNCPIAKGCGWCSGYNYEIFGTPNKRATFICAMHKARVLSIAYLWNNWYRCKNSPERYSLTIPQDWAEEIIGHEEYEKLKSLSE